uniref:N-terminal kinase-like protein n=1 Tax=Phallusia mammillata TaxID=59560 RepID=A0A6F9DSN8_9ASCI|nr:N-terminal kinase-like protein [Phallusia mammillata]
MWSFFSRDPAKGFPYEVGEKVEGLDADHSIWTMHAGKQKSNGQPVSVFLFDVSANSETAKQTAQASVKRLKTLKHPNILTFIDSLETDKCIYVVTEPVMPLAVHLKEIESKTNEFAVSWGLHQIVKGLSFLLNSVNVIHNNVCMSSMFVDSAGEWKLGGIDYMYPATGEGSNMPPIKTAPALEKYDPPEKSQSSGRQRKAPKWSSDMWGLGCLIWEVFNGRLPRTSSLKVIGKIPKSLVRNYCELVSANPTSRPNPDKFLEGCKVQGSFMSNHFVQTNLFLEEIQIKEPHEQALFFTDLTKHLDEFPIIYSKHKILPQLLNAFQFGNGGPAVLPPLFKLGKHLDTTEYQAQIVPCVVKLFTSTDRATRIHLLRQLPLFVEHLQPAVVNSQVFPNMITGFMDTNPAIREQSVKGMFLLAPKLNENNLNNELMKHFARLQSRDDQGPIRTNTTVCLGKLTQHLNPATRQKVVSSAFARAMKDPFPAARTAGVLAMCNNIQYFTTKDCAYKALPALCAMTVDPDKQVRENAFKTIKVFIDKLQTASDDPEEALKMDQVANTVGTSATNTASWAGWMTGVSSLTSKLYTNKAATPQPTDPAKDANNKPDATQSKPIDNTVTSPKPTPKVEDTNEEDEDENDNGWDENDDWDGLEEFGSDIGKLPPVAKPRKTYRGKLITTRKLREMEENIWDDLHAQKTSQSHEDDNETETNGDNGGWGNSGWDADLLETSQDNNGSADKKTEDDWSNGWQDEGFDPTPSVNKPSNTFSAQTVQSDLTPASTYNWNQTESKAQKDPEEDFFNEFAPKPKKTLGQKNRSQAKTKPVNKMPVKKTSPKPSTDFDAGWEDDSWNDNSWGDDQGVSKADKAKQEREERRKQRQKQLEENRSAKAGPKKLGARKCD